MIKRLTNARRAPRKFQRGYIINPFVFDSGGGGYPDLPVQDNLVVWLDAANSASITESAGVVSQWNDLSGNANHASRSTEAQRPNLVSGPNGYGAIDCGAYASNLSLGFPGNISGKTFILVVEQSKGGGFLFGDDATYPFYPSSGGIAGSPPLSGSLSDSALRTGSATTRRNGKTITPTVDFKGAGWQILVFRTDGNNVTIDNLCRDRGTSARTGGNTYGEVIVYSTVLSDADVELVEAHLAAKWKIANLLPRDHDGYSATISTLPIATVPLAWFDASNATFRHDVSGDTCELHDLSGNKYSMSWTVNLGRSPDVLSAEQNGLDVVDFGDYVASNAGRTLRGTSMAAKTFAIVLKTGATRNGGHIIGHPSYYDFHRDGSPGSYTSSILSNTYAAATLKSGANRKDGASATLTSTGCSDGWQILVFRTDGSAVNQSQLFRDRNNAAFGGGVFAEELVFSDVLSDGDTEKIEGYLAHKWGLTALLPGGHPYKSSPP